MDDNNKDLEEQKGFIDLIKKLVEYQAIISKAEAQLALREGQDQVKKIVSSTENRLQDQAKKFGTKMNEAEKKYVQNGEEKKGILEQYKSVLDEVNEKYESLLQNCIEKENELQADEQSTSIEQKENQIEIKKIKKEFTNTKKEVVEATKNMNLEEAREKIAKLEELKEKEDELRAKDK